MSNTQTGEVLSEVLTDEVTSIVLCHLSEKNNAPHLAESEVLMHIGEYYSGSLSISKQEGPEFSNWLGQTNPEKVSSLT